MDTTTASQTENIVQVREQKKKEVSVKVAHKEIESAELSKQEELDYIYTVFDKIFRLSLGETPIYSGAYYHADFSISLEQAQRQKCEHICKMLNIKEGTRVLDLGCGWGGWLNYLKKEVGAVGVGVNLSSGQVASCRKNGLDVYLKDARYVKPDDFGTFDVVTSMGCPEHWCTVEDYKAGKQDQVYKDVIAGIKELIPSGNRIYLQTMTFGRYALPLEEFDIKAPRQSPAFILAMLRKQFPYSWVPYGGEHLIRCAEPHFKEIEHQSGRVDYVQTIKEWAKMMRQFGFRKYMLYASLIPKYIVDKEFRWNLRVLQECANRKAFEREIFGLARIVLEKV